MCYFGSNAAYILSVFTTLWSCSVSCPQHYLKCDVTEMGCQHWKLESAKLLVTKVEGIKLQEMEILK